MATTFHVTNFKNKYIDLITGVSTSATPFGRVNFFNGAQPADPSVAAPGSAVFASVTNANDLSSRMSSSGAGITTMASPTGPTSPAGAASVASLTFARIFNGTATPLIDTPVSLTGGGGGVILDTLSPSVSVGPIIQAFSFKTPTSAGTIRLNSALADRISDLWGGASAQSPLMGINTSGGCVINFYSGSAPADADTAPTGTLLASITIGAANIWAAAAGGAAALASLPSVTASGTGTIGYCRIIKTFGSLTFVIQGSASTSGADFIINNTAVTSGVTTVQLTEATISV